ncbi:OmpA family protein [Vibrio sp.]|nr:OmpA family protein [Vibrio sp.]
MKTTALALATLILLSGCQATKRQNATTGEEETNPTTQGAILGALSGVALGLASGDNATERRQNALWGAAGGAAVGGGIGYYFDQQEEALRQELLNSGVQVERVGENQLRLRMKNGIGFSSNSHQLDSSIKNTLRGVSKILAEYKDTSLVIEGFTDSSGKDSYNQSLSEKRAESVRSYLVSNHVASGRAISRGYGERHPICSNNTNNGKACNRRVEIKILPLK